MNPTKKRFGLLFACLILVVSGSLLQAQVTRASLTGIVHDSTGAVVPGVKVMATHVATGVTYPGETNREGDYTISALPVGEYTITFSVTGFKSFVRSGIALTAGLVVRVDPVLEVGELSEKIEVTAETPLLQTETATSLENVTSEVFATMPLAFGSRGRNMAEFANKLVPGVRSSDYTMSVQGTPGASVGILVEGMTNLAGFLPGDFAEASISAESIQEMTVLTGNVSAEQGRQSGGTMSFTLKSGTNKFHGSAFYNLRHEYVNANDWNNNLQLAADPNFTKANTVRFTRPLDRQKNWALSGGGPVYIPKIYNGKDKTFFFCTMERFDTYTTGPGTLTRSVPQPEMWAGNLSRLLGAKVGTDALGRDVLEGMIYDPNTLHKVGTRYVADPFTGNIIPANRISKVANNFAAVFNKWYQPVNTNLTNNSYTSNQYRLHSPQYTIKADHSFSPRHKVSGYYYKHGFPRNFQENVSEVWSLLDPDMGGPLSRSIRQWRRGYSWNVAEDWVISNNKLNHFMVGLNNNANGFNSRQVGKSYADSWGIKGVGLGAPDDQVTRPVINLGSSPVVTFQSWNHDANRDEFYRNIIFSDSFSWYRGTHAFKFGTEWNFLSYDSQQYNNTGGNFNFASRTTAIPGEGFTSRIGNSFASLLLGLVDSATMGPIFNPITHYYYGSAFIQDTWKITPKITFNYGLRWSGNSDYYENQDQIANFNPTLPDPNYGNILGAVEYMGNGTGRAGRRTLFSGHWRDWGPNAGLAYRVTNWTVFRAGYGISYTPEGFGWVYPWRAGFDQTNTVAADSKGTYLSVFNIDDGYPNVTVAPNMDPSYAAKYGGGRRNSPEYTISGYVQNFSAGLQTEIRKDLRVDLEWRGSKGTRLHAGGNVYPNQINPKELSRGSVLTQTISSAAQASAAGLPYPYAGFSGLGAYTLLPFPQLGSRGLSAYGDPVGNSTYHSGNLIVTKRMSQGYYLYAAYTFSKSITDVTNVANSGGGGSIQNTYNARANKAIAGADRTHVLKSAINWELPFGRGKALLGSAAGVLNGIIGGWRLAAILNYQSGTPLGHPSSRVSPNFWNGGGVYANYNTPAGGFKNIFNPDTFNPWNNNDPGNIYFDKSAFTDAAAQSLGNSPNRFPQVRGLWNCSEDATLTKGFRFKERARLEVRVELYNLFNRHFFGGPNMGLSNAYFGNVTTASGRRTGQASLRLEF